MYDDIKGASSDAGAALSIADKAGLNTLTNFADENFQVLRSLNRNMADTILKPSDEPYRVIAGYDNYNLETDNKSYLSGYDLSANSMYTLATRGLIIKTASASVSVIPKFQPAMTTAATATSTSLPSLCPGSTNLPTTYASLPS